MKKFLIILIIIFISLSCTNTKPEITYGFMQLILYQEEDAVKEHLSFFIIANDEDGVDNLDLLYLYNDSEQLVWKIKSDEWITFTDDSKTWIGTRSITMQEGNIPRGLYRAVLFNKGGESAERSFTYDGKVRYPFPELIINNGVYTILSEWPVNRLICYNSAGEYVTDIQLTSISGPILELKLPNNVITAALWAEDEENSCSAYTNVVPVK